MAEYTKIGRIRPEYADTWDAARSYTALEVVKSADSYQAYIAKQDVPASTPLTDEAYWGVVLDVSDVIAESVAATNRANTAAEQADAAREAIKGDFEELSERTDQLSEEIADIGTIRHKIDDAVESKTSSNVFDGNVTRGRYIDAEGAIGAYDVLCYTNSYYPVQENDKFIAGTGENTQAQLRYVTAYDADKNVMSSSGMNGGYLYTVPAGVAFVRFSFYLSDVDSDTFRLNKSAFLLPYEPHESTEVPMGYGTLKNIEDQPLTALPDYMLGVMSYRPLGQLSKPYICLVSDDGDDDMVTYSIPMVESKGVPCTWAIMSTSEIFKGDNVAEKVAAVVNSVANHGCAIAQHGGTNWTEFTEKDLNEFFDRENAFMASYGLEAKCAVAPSHYISPLTCAVAGGKYGVVRSGFYGQNPHTGNTCEELVKAYPNYTCGARTNVFALSSQNLAGIPQEQARAVIDYAKANNLLVIFYWHENSLDDSLKARIEDAIDYGKKQEIEFITLDEVATII